MKSALFGFWVRLSLELLARAALAHVHPHCLQNQGSQRHSDAFGVVPKGVPNSIQVRLFSHAVQCLFPVHRPDVRSLSYNGGSPEL